MNAKTNTLIFLAVSLFTKCHAEQAPALTQDSFSQLFRSFKPVPEGRTPNVDDTRIIYINNSVKNQLSFRLGNLTSLLDHPDFNVTRKTMFYVYGFAEVVSDMSVLRVTDAYVQRGDHNILLLDWANLAFGSYFKVIFNIKKVGTFAGKALVELLKNGLSIKGLHLIGHSAGVHVAAVVARTLKENNFNVPRLTGLDPAYPGFYPAIDAPPISAKDAVFVDIIHTDCGKYATPFNSGHADFWPNGGQAPQPGCQPVTLLFTNENFCSHWRSWNYWAESVTGGNFLATQCDNYNAFLKGNCSGNAHMGFLATPELRGNFYLRTASKEPFALGQRGAVC